MIEIYNNRIRSSVFYAFFLGIAGLLYSLIFVSTTEKPIENLYIFCTWYRTWGRAIVILLCSAIDFTASMKLLSGDKAKQPDKPAKYPPFLLIAFAGFVFMMLWRHYSGVLFDFGLYREILIFIWPLYVFGTLGVFWLLFTAIFVFIDCILGYDIILNRKARSKN